MADILTAIGSKSEGSIWLSTNGAPSVIARRLHAAEAKSLKSPASMAGVGTKSKSELGSERVFVP